MAGQAGLKLVEKGSDILNLYPGQILLTMGYAGMSPKLSRPTYIMITTHT